MRRATFVECTLLVCKITDRESDAPRSFSRSPAAHSVEEMCALDMTSPKRIELTCINGLHQRAPVDHVRFGRQAGISGFYIKSPCR